MKTWASRKIPFGRELYIDREDFMENPPKKYFRLFPGNEVRLMGAYFVKCVDYEKDENGNVTVDPLYLRSGDQERKRIYRKKSKRNHPLGSCPDRHSRQKCVSMRILIDEEKGVYNEEDGSMNINPNSLTVRKC